MEPLQIAVENADLDIALLLMKYGADVTEISDGTAKDGDGETLPKRDVNNLKLEICHGDTEIPLRCPP